ncbi:MAG: NTP transferase domain-containing protein [Anaerolineae bacterium]|nr:NTP transferase domain-containing protein [Anaerolineae bacterium]
MTKDLYAVIMAGGIGSRLWPRSRGATPKQFLDLIGERTMLQETVDRIEPLVPMERVLVVVGDDHATTVREQVPGLPAENVLCEPGPRNTAPAIGLATVAVRERNPHGLMAVFPADHRIADGAGFRAAISAAARVARDDYLVTLGITPDHAHTGYGYIQRGELLDTGDGRADSIPIYRVVRFTEKPDAATAERFVASGDYYWNGGIFVWQADTILREIARQMPALHDELVTLAHAWDTPRRAETLAAAWQRVPRTSIDYGVMESAARVATVPVDIGWDDVGNWATLSALLPAGAGGNATRGGGEAVLIDTSDTYVYAGDGRLVATIGLDGFIVVVTHDAVLVCPKKHAQDVRDVVKAIESRGIDKYL